MVGAEKKEQRGQAVKRLRSLFDMHHVAFGAPEDLGGVVLSLHENRHFAMDFWAVVGALTSSESGALSDDEMLETVVESATGTESLALPEYLLPGVIELRQMLAGVDVERPVELPDAISQPSDALLPRQRQSFEPHVEPFPRRVDPARRPIPAADTRVARKSIGEALARLEQTSRELREQLAAIDEHVTGPEEFVEPEYAHEAEPREPGSCEAESLDLPQRTEAVAEEAREVRAVSAEPVCEVPHTSPEATGETEVFAPRPVYTLAHRGLATPEYDHDPSIVAPLSEEDEEQERFPVARIAVGAVLLVTLLAVRFLAMRPDVWHALLAGAGPSLHSAYSNVAERLSVLKREATTPTRQATSDTTGGGTTAADANSTAAAAPASGPSASDTATDLTAEPVTSEAADAQLTVTPQEPVKKQTEANRNTTRAERVESAAADESVVRVPASMMAAHLISSRVPAYPEGAKAQEIEGPVVMEVVVATNGAVKQVHVIDGDRRLRAAAEEAVMKWRYRPYLLNGSPVEIATTVRVDFRLPQ